MENIIHYADILAIPFFLLLIIYIASKPKKKLMEYVMLSFAIVGICCDVLFSVYFVFYKKPKCQYL